MLICVYIYHKWDFCQFWECAVQTYWAAVTPLCVSRPFVLFTTPLKLPPPPKAPFNSSLGLFSICCPLQQLSGVILYLLPPSTALGGYSLSVAPFNSSLGLFSICCPLQQLSGVILYLLPPSTALGGYSLSVIKCSFAFSSPTKPKFCVFHNFHCIFCRVVWNFKGFLDMHLCRNWLIHIMSIKQGCDGVIIWDAVILIVD